MPPTNTIAKVRFSSARPQRVHIEDGHGVAAELLCMERGQKMAISDSSVMIYVILGSAVVTADGEESPLETNYLMAPGGEFTLTNAGEHRLVCMAFKAAS